MYDDTAVWGIFSVAIMLSAMLSVPLAALAYRYTPPKIVIKYRTPKERIVYVDKETKVQYTISKDKVDKLRKIYNISEEAAKHLNDAAWTTLEKIHQESIDDKSRLKEVSENHANLQGEFNNLKRILRAAFESGGGEKDAAVERTSQKQKV